MFKKFMIGTAIGLGVAAVTAGVTCTALYFTVWKDQGKKQEQEVSKEQVAFTEALNSSTFTKPLAFTLEVAKQENQEEAIIATLQTKWSGKANPIQIKQVGNEYVVTLNKNTNTYTNNIYSKVWANILEESENADFKNIKQVGYGFRLVKQSDTQYQLVPTYTQVNFETKPTWLEKDSFRVSLLSNKDLVSQITIA